ncbi:MAG: transposase [Nitrospiraceae bacterium]|nr:MAG: transposase [Nitrospiraceae bacterium]
MARPLRIEYEGAVYHVTARGNERKAIFKEDPDRSLFLDILYKANKRYNILCHAYCLMDNHYHLIMETPEGNLSKGMRQLNGVYTLMFNKEHRRVGHIFQGRYKAILIQKESHLLEVCRYVVLNPVRARAVEKPEEWKWSSYQATSGKSKPHECLSRDWILGQFAESRMAAQKRYEDFVMAGIGENGIWKKVKGQSLLGDDDFVDTLITYVKGYEEMVEIPKVQRYMSRPEMRELFKETVFNNRQSRNKKILEAVYKYGYTQKEVADYLGKHYTTISGIIGKILKSKT